MRPRPQRVCLAARALVFTLVFAPLEAACGYPQLVSRSVAQGTPAAGPSPLALVVLYAGNDAREASADQGGNIWVATQSGVRVITDAGSQTFTAAASGLTSDDVRTIAGGPPGQALVGFGPQGTPGQMGNPPALNYLTLAGAAPPSVEAYGFNLTFEIIQTNHAVYDPARHQFWIGTDEGVSLFDSARDLLEHRHPVHPHGFANGVAITRGGDVWDADEFQLSRLNAGPQANFSATFDPVLQPFPLSQQNLSAVALDANDHPWVGSLTQGLALVDPDSLAVTRWTVAAGLPSLLVQAVAVDPDGSIWVGTADRGLGRLDPHSGAWQAFDESSLGSNEVRDLAIVPAAPGTPRQLLIVTPAGVASYRGT